MTTIWHVPTVVITLLAWVSSASSSFVDVAKKEVVRRQLVGRAVGAYSDNTLPRVRPSDALNASASAFTMTQVSRAQVAPEPEEGAAVEPTPPGDPAQAREKEGSEAWWRERVAALRAAVARDESRVETLESQIAGLQTDVASRDDPAQRAVLADRLKQALVDLNRTRTKIQAESAAIEKVKEEARRQGIAPGWTR